MRETHPKILLERKAARLRRKTNNPNLRSQLDPGLTKRQILTAALIRPSKLLMFSPIVQLMSLYVALVFGLLYLLFTTFGIVYRGQYHFGTGVAGLSFLGIGVGELLGLFVFGILSDRIMKTRRKADQVVDPKPEYRLIMMMWFPPAIPVGLFLYGWTAYYQVHWMVPIVGSFIVGFGAFFVIVSSHRPGFISQSNTYRCPPNST